MTANKATIVIDLLNSLWLITIFVALFCLIPTQVASWGRKQIEPERGFSVNKKSHVIDEQYWSYFIGSYLRFLAVAIISVLALSYLDLISWFTLALAYGICLVTSYLETSNWQWRKSKKAIQSSLFGLVDILDRGFSLKQLFKALWSRLQKLNHYIYAYINSLIARQGIVFTVLLGVILGSALIIRWEYPLNELRFSHPDSYSSLLLTQQLITGNYPTANFLPVLPALTALLSIFGSIEPMQTLRFLSPVLGIVIVISVGYLSYVLSQNFGSALVAMLGIGIYLFTLPTIIDPQLPTWLANIINSLNNGLIRQWNSNGLEIGTISLLLGLGYVYDRPKSAYSPTFIINLVCSLILIAMSAPSLLIVVAIAPLGILGGKKLALLAISLAWITLAIFAAIASGELVWLQSFLITLPIPLSLLAGLLFSAIAEAGKALSSKWSETFCLALVLALACNFLLPSSPQLTYVEYDIAARKTLEIKNLMPRNTWTVAAPTEQLAEITMARAGIKIWLCLSKSIETRQETLDSIFLWATQTYLSLLKNYPL